MFSGPKDQHPGAHGFIDKLFFVASSLSLAAIIIASWLFYDYQQNFSNLVKSSQTQIQDGSIGLDKLSSDALNKLSFAGDSALAEARDARNLSQDAVALAKQSLDAPNYMTNVVSGTSGGVVRPVSRVQRARRGKTVQTGQMAQMVRLPFCR